MDNLNFKNWMLNEFKDIFGFSREQNGQEKAKGLFHTEINPELPINRLNIETITDRLKKLSINGKPSHYKFVNWVQWGEGIGALRLKIHPDLHVEIARKSYDLEGTPTWATKRLWILNRSGYGGHEDFIVQEMLTQLEHVDKLPVDSPKRDYKELENLAFAMASKMKHVARNYFLYEGIRKVSENEYIIRFGVRGQGVEAPDQSKVIENQTMLFFHPDSGKIRLTNKNIETPVGGGYKWEIMPPDTDINFLPTQPREEMVEAIATVMRWY